MTDFTQRTVLHKAIELLPEYILPDLARFIEFLRFKTGEVQTSVFTATTAYRYPTITLPATTLHELVGIMPSDFAGDALTDTEALYDNL
jgi:hypothetical protein